MKLLQTVYVWNSLSSSSEMLLISFTDRLYAAMGLGLSKILLNSQQHLLLMPASASNNVQHQTSLIYLLAICTADKKQCTRFPGWLSCILYYLKYKLTSDQTSGDNNKYAVFLIGVLSHLGCLSRWFLPSNSWCCLILIEMVRLMIIYIQNTVPTPALHHFSRLGPPIIFYT